MLLTRPAGAAYAALIAILASPVTTAQLAGMDRRADSWEMSVGLFGTSSENAEGENGSAIDVDSGWGVAFGFAYNWTQHFATRFDGSWSRPDYQAVFVTEEGETVAVDHTLTLFNGHFSAVWNMLEGPFTPYLQAGLGWSYVDSNISDGPPATGCWWDPWWGYICAPFYSTYNDTNFSWNVGAGVRFDVSRTMFVRGGYELVTLDDNAGADPSFDAFRIELGWKF